MKVITCEVEFTVSAAAHTGADGEVPFMVRQITDDEINDVRQRLSAVVEELNAAHPTLYVSVEERTE